MSCVFSLQVLEDEDLLIEFQNDGHVETPALMVVASDVPTRQTRL